MSDPRRTTAFDPRLDAIARYALAIGAVLVLLLPSARGFSEQVGWLPMWLLAMPAAAWWGAHGFALPRRRGPEAAESRRARPRRSGPQARRRGRAGLRAAWSRAA
jgi:hypothetical protein